MHTRGVGGGGGKTQAPDQIFKKLVNKNAIKQIIGKPPDNFLWKALTRNRSYPLPWIFNPCALMKISYQSVSRRFQSRLDLVPKIDGTEKRIDSDDGSFLQVLFDPFRQAGHTRNTHPHQGPVLVNLRFSLQIEQ